MKNPSHNPTSIDNTRRVSTFLSAEWRSLVMANYEVNPQYLLPYLPAGTELDTWQGRHYVSLVGFMFVDVRLLGIPIPFHTDFEEVNLRFYVKRKEGNQWKRGVVFIKEIVPKKMVTWVANSFYKEHYITLPMSHRFDNHKEGILWEYTWGGNDISKISVLTEKIAVPIPVKSEPEFITEHYWGYTRITEHQTTEYEVTHPRWNMYPVKQYTLQLNVESIYGRYFHEILQSAPVSVFVAEGSPISVLQKTKIALYT